MGEQQKQTTPLNGKPSPLKRIEAHAAFASIIETFEVADHEQLNRRALPEIAAWRAAEGSVERSNMNGWHSPYTLFERTEPGLAAIAGRIKQALVMAVRRHWPEFDPASCGTFLEGWVNVNGKGAYNVPHSHNQYHLSGVYYVSVPKPTQEWSGAIVFLTPLGALTPLMDFGARMSDHELRLQPTSGRLLVFPSYLRHWVMPSQEDEERVSIAFNLRVHDPAAA